MTVILGVTGALYCATALFIAFRLRHLSRKIFPWTNWEPHVSIIVAVRNEESVVSRCLESLAALDYPAEKTQILIINDDSQDESGLCIDAFCRSHKRMQAIHLGRGEKKLPGKAGAVLRAMEDANGEIVFLTDADCQVPPTWIKSLLAGFDSNTGLIGGFTVLRALDAPEPRFAAVQATDWLFLLGIAAIAVDMRRPVSWMGNNMAFRRSAYEAAGGYMNLGHSLIEDFTLLDAISRKTHYAVAVQPECSAVVVSTPVPSISMLYKQRRRWAVGIAPVRPLGKFLMISSVIMHLLVLVGFFVVPWISSIFLLAKLISDYQIIGCMAKQTHSSVALRSFLGFEFFYGLYSLIIPLSLFIDRRIQWKDQDFSVHA